MFLTHLFRTLIMVKIWFLLLVVWKFLLPKHLSLRIFGGIFLLELSAVHCHSGDAGTAHKSDYFLQKAVLLRLSLLVAWSLQLTWLFFSFMTLNFVLIVFSVKIVLNEMFFNRIWIVLWLQAILCLLANNFGKLFHLILVRTLRLYQQFLSNAARSQIKRLWFTPARGSKFRHIVWRLENCFVLVLKRSRGNIF